jgi:peptidoglycan/xylan/chitin deacetylase (PgdA/CDA1 family)
VTHKALARIPRDAAFTELANSRWMLTEMLGHDVDVVAYPYSNQNREVRDLARQAGYRCAVRGMGRMNSKRVDPFGLRRIKVEPETTVASLRRTLFRERFLRF